MENTTQPDATASVHTGAPPAGGRRKVGRKLLAFSTVAALLCAGLATAAPAQAAAAATTTLPGSLVQGGVTNNGTTTVYGYAKAGEAFTASFSSQWNSAGAAITVTNPAGTVVKTGTLTAGASGGSFSYSGTATTAGVWSVKVRDTGGVGAGANLNWNVSVKAGGVAIPGRVFSDSIGIENQASTTFSVYALTDTGAIYKETLRGYNGVDSTLQVNNKGNVKVGDATCAPVYKSVPMQKSTELASVGKQYTQPGFTAGSCAGLKIYRLFLDQPAADLPATATAWADKRTTAQWVGPKYVAPSITGLKYTRASLASDAGNLTGTTTQPGTATIQIDADGDGVYTGAKDVTVTTSVTSAGAFTVPWNGKDKTGATVSIRTKVNFKATLARTNEAHFLRIDDEVSTGGIQVNRLTGGTTSTDRLYYDDTMFSGDSGSRDSLTAPWTSGAAGIASTGGIHKWTSPAGAVPNQNDSVHGGYGDLRSIDDWTYGADSAVATASLLPPGQLQIDKVAVKPTVDHGGQASFTITVKNIGAGVSPATTITDVPTLAHLSNVTITPAGGKAQTAMTVAVPQLAAGASTTYTVTGTVADGIDAWTIPNRVTVANPPGDLPPVVLHPCTDNAAYSCAQIVTPSINGQLELDKTADAPVVDHGGKASFTITVSNIGPVPATFDLTDVPTTDHLTDVTITPEGRTAQTDMTVKGIQLAPGAKTTLKVTGTVADGYDVWTIPNRVTIANPTGFDPVVVDDACTDDATYSCAQVTTTPLIGQLEFDKTAVSPTVDHGGQAQFTITAKNIGPIPATFDLTDVPTTDYLSNVTITPQGGAAQSDMTVKGIQLAPGASTTLTVTGTVAGGYDVLTIPNRVTIANPPGFDPPVVDDACTDDPTYSCAQVVTNPLIGQLELDKTAVVPTVAHKGHAQFTITVSNTGQIPATDIALTDVPTLDHLTDVTITPEGGQPQTDMVVKGIALAPGAKTTLAVTGTVKDGVDEWTIPNRVTITNPTGFNPVVVDHKCTDVASYSCAQVTVPGIAPAAAPKPAEPAPVVASPAAPALAHTGSDTEATLWIGGSIAVALGLLGAVLLLATRKRRVQAAASADETPLTLDDLL